VTFHTRSDQLGVVVGARSQLEKVAVRPVIDIQRTLTYLFSTHYHPYVPELMHRLLSGTLTDLQDGDTELPAQDLLSSQGYGPTSLVAKPYPLKDVDFTTGGAYSGYNWELFYHAPLTIAIHLSRNGRYEDAQRWFHFVFDPTDDSSDPSPERFWKVKPLRRKDVPTIADILLNLATGADPNLQRDTITAISQWQKAPLRPHVVARQRQTPYMLKAVTAYLDNLIDWGDALFRQDTGEAINEATQLYVLAANILGRRPERVPKKGDVAPQTYKRLRGHLDAFNNTLVALESDVPFDVMPHPSSGGTEVDRFVTLESLGKTLYFCVPHNEKLLNYWDTVADRLFKIRNSLNLQGVFRQLPLFEPPIDPGLLARAVAAGLDVGAVTAGLHQPLPLVRSQLLLGKATEICQEVKSLGGHLLASTEKEDNEALSVLRARHERVILGLVEAVRYGQLQEAAKIREGIEQSIANTAQRYAYYERLLGKSAGDIKIPALDSLDHDGLLHLAFRSQEPAVALRPVEPNVVEVAGLKLSPGEVTELALLEASQVGQDIAGVMESVGSFMSMIPDISAHVTPVGLGAAARFGGTNLGHLFRGMAAGARAVAGRLSHEANRASRIASFIRREEEWAFQSNLAAGEMTHLFKQLRAAEIREAIAQREWDNHQQQLRHAQEIERFLTDERTGKKTGQALYAFLKREVRGLYNQCFQLAFDVARKAERALQHELGDPELRFIQPTYTTGKEGLLAGEKLYLDLKRMETAYLELNRREYELTRHVSVLELDPHALVELRATGRCTVRIPEELYDLDCPGHYFRRLRSVAVSLPCVVGPYTSVNCTLRLLKSSVRRSALLADGYARDGEADERFSDHFGSVQAVVTSTAHHDAGLFETNLRDERYLPFELAGAISEWQIELPADVRQFDFATISDVVLHVRYTAREGGAALATAATAELAAAIDEARAAGSVRLLSVRHELPLEWARLKNHTLTTTARAPLTLKLTRNHYPFWAEGRLGALKQVELLAAGGKRTVQVSDAPTGGNIDRLEANPALAGLRAGKLAHPEAIPPIGELKLFLDDNTMTDLWVALTWGKAL
jgi:hypothetical protein